MKRIAIIGSGISGVVLGQKLAPHAEVMLFEKAKGIGGRMSTRYAEPFAFDHGAPGFTVQTPEFQQFLAPHIKAGIIAEWYAKVIDWDLQPQDSSSLERYLVAVPNMNSLGKALASGLKVRTQCEVAPLNNRDGTDWELYDKNGQSLGCFDWVIATAPAVQTVRLFASYLPDNELIRSVNMQSCYTLMLGFNRPWDREWAVAKVHHNPIESIYVNSSKPGRNAEVTSLVIHSQGDWTKTHINHELKTVQTSLLEAFNCLTAIDATTADYISTHLWRYAMVDNATQPGCYINYDLGLAATGDWCTNSRIEAVWLQANRLGDLIISKL